MKLPQFLNITPPLLGLVFALCQAGFPAAAQIPVRLEINTNGQFNTLSWNSVIGGQYLLYSSTDLAGLWTEVPTVPKPLVADSPSLSYMVERTSLTHFYRVAQLGQFEPSRLAWIPPGTFLMGSPLAEIGHEVNERPETLVTLTRGFWIGRYEVTQEEYLAVMGNNPSLHQGDLIRPVERVTWFDALEYCARLTNLDRTAGRISAQSFYRLPTEAEWEYACRAGSATRFFYGADPDAVLLVDYAWYEDNSGGTTHPVGSKRPNAWGLYDTAGNVYEWCQDWFNPYPGGSVTDPTGSETGTGRILRGGSYLRLSQHGRSANRHLTTPGNRSSHYGFRVVLDPGQP